MCLMESIQDMSTLIYFLLQSGLKTGSAQPFVSDGVFESSKMLGARSKCKWYVNITETVYWAKVLLLL